MPKENQVRREADAVHVDKTMRVTTTLGFIVSVVIATGWGVKYQARSEEADRAMEVRVDRLERRQDTYIERRNDQHGAIFDTTEDLEAAIEIIREAWAREHQEELRLR